MTRYLPICQHRYVGPSRSVAGQRRMRCTDCGLEFVRIESETPLRTAAPRGFRY